MNQVSGNLLLARIPPKTHRRRARGPPRTHARQCTYMVCCRHARLGRPRHKKCRFAMPHVHRASTNRSRRNPEVDTVEHSKDYSGRWGDFPCNKSIRDIHKHWPQKPLYKTHHHKHERKCLLSAVLKCIRDPRQSVYCLTCKHKHSSSRDRSHTSLGPNRGCIRSH